MIWRRQYIPGFYNTENSKGKIRKKGRARGLGRKFPSGVQGKASAAEGWERVQEAESKC